MNGVASRPWKGAVLGVLGGAAGTVAMGGYWKALQALTGSDPRMAVRDGEDHALEDISLVGQHHEESEGSTAAMGRIAYEQAAGKEPQSGETKSLLSYLVHYGYGSLQGGIFGALSDGRPARDIAGGAAFGTALWLGGDELGVAALGLAEGPGKYPLSQHLSRWGAHLTYGIATAAVTTTLRRMF